LRITSKSEDKTGAITTAILQALIIGILITPIGQITGKLIDKWFENTELEDLQKQKLKLEIKELKDKAAKTEDELHENATIKKKKSNFYENLNKYPKVNKVSFSLVDRTKKQVLEEKSVLRSNFKDFILATDEIEPLEIEEALIEIIAPVLKKGRYKWIGIYQGEPIAFSMNSSEFKEKVQYGQVEFKNGFSINCNLQIKRKLNSEGSIHDVSYEVIRVNKYFENENPIETKEGKNHRQTKEKKNGQLQLFSRADENTN
jgi:hypothetical protein